MSAAPRWKLPARERWLLVFVLIVSPIALAAVKMDVAQAATLPFITVDQFGYLPGSDKIAVLRNPILGYDAEQNYQPGDPLQVISVANNEPVFDASPTKWNGGKTDPISGDQVWWFDFSTLHTSGRFYIFDPQNKIRSPEFNIDADVYRPVLKQALRTFFYQRAGFAKEEPYADAGWQDAASHLGPLQDAEARLYSDRGNIDTARDLSGGWYDAGDFNHYTAWHANYIITLLHAYLENPVAWSDDFNIPESGNGIPDLLDEVRWGLEWQKKMQDGAADGGVLSILGVDHGSPPSAAQKPSVYGPATTHATLASAASFALAAAVFNGLSSDQLPASYAADLLQRAEAAWTWAMKNPEVVFYNNRDQAAGVGAGQQETDEQGRAVDWRRAAVYLFAVTGEPIYQQYILLGYKYTPVVAWAGNIDTFHESETATMLFYSILPLADATAAEAIGKGYRDAMSRESTGAAFKSKASAYRAFLPAEHYTWGSNANVAREGLLFTNIGSYDVGGWRATDISHAALGYLHYLHGVNPLGMVYLSNMYALGVTRSVNEFYHSWFSDGSPLWDRVGESTYGPAPGFLVGGPTLQYDRDACCPSNCGSVENNRRCNSMSLVPPKEQPVMKAFKEFNAGWPLNSWSVTENSNGYQSDYLRLLSKFVVAAPAGN